MIPDESDKKPMSIQVVVETAVKAATHSVLDFAQAQIKEKDAQLDTMRKELQSMTQTAQVFQAALNDTANILGVPAGSPLVTAVPQAAREARTQATKKLVEIAAGLANPNRPVNATHVVIEEPAPFDPND